MRREDALWARIGRDGISRVIEEEKRARGVSDMDLARLHPDLSPYTIGDMRRGDHDPSYKSLRIVVQALAKLSELRPGISVLSIWGRASDPIPPPRTLWKIGLLAATVTLLLLIPMTAEAQTQLPWGPGGTEMGASSPVYTQPIRVIDAMAGTLSDAHRPIWVKARNAALANWQIPFTVERITEAQLPYPWTTENINGGLAITDIRPNAILIVRDRTGSGGDYAGWDPNNLGGIAAFSPWAPYWWQSYWFPQLVGLIGHEVGHTLGFGHGGNGIMGGNLKPNAVELAAVHAYWG